MILIVDIGNTNISFGVYKKDEILCKFRIGSKNLRTSDEYGLLLSQLLCEHKIDKSLIKGIAISSVVPNIMHSFTNAVKKFLNIVPFNISDIKNSPIKVNLPNPRELGADRLADSVAAYTKYSRAAIIIDFGTATTFDVISKEGEFLTGLTSPGIKISAHSLWQHTAKLPDIKIERPKSIIATDTITSMQSGLVYGYIGQIEYICKNLMKAYNKEMLVIATGGLARVIEGGTDIINIFDANLTLDGIKILYELNKEDIK